MKLLVKYSDCYVKYIYICHTTKPVTDLSE